MGRNIKKTSNSSNLLHRKLKLSHHRHSGKRLPHKHTSWGLLVLMMVATTAIVSFATKSALADSITLSGGVTVGAKVPGPPPSSPAVIEQPLDGQTFTQSQITVSGTCPEATIVQIYKNNILAGSTACVDEKFELEIDLLRGNNDLVAKVLDNLDQYGPDSETVSVVYEVIAGTIPPASAGQLSRPPSAQALQLPQLLITTESVYQGSLVNQSFQLNLIVNGGKAPYAVFVDWGDGNEDLVSQASADKFSVSHQYNRTGVYEVTLRAADALASQSFIRITVVVHSGEAVITSSATTFIDNYADPLFFVWPMYGLLFVIVSIFWLGERYELHKINKAVHKSRKTVKKATA